MSDQVFLLLTVSGWPLVLSIQKKKSGLGGWDTDLFFFRSLPSPRPPSTPSPFVWCCAWCCVWFFSFELSFCTLLRVWLCLLWLCALSCFFCFCFYFVLDFALCLLCALSCCALFCFSLCFVAWIYFTVLCSALMLRFCALFLCWMLKGRERTSFLFVISVLSPFALRFAFKFSAFVLCSCAFL